MNERNNKQNIEKIIKFEDEKKTVCTQQNIDC